MIRKEKLPPSSWSTPLIFLNVLAIGRGELFFKNRVGGGQQQQQQSKQTGKQTGKLALNQIAGEIYVSICEGAE